jgi:hypothetical protein
VHCDFCISRADTVATFRLAANPEGRCEAGPPRVRSAVDVPAAKIAAPRLVSRGGRMSGPVVINNPPEGNNNSAIILGVVVVIVILIVVWLLFANGAPAPTPGPGAS